MKISEEKLIDDAPILTQNTGWWMIVEEPAGDVVVRS